MQMTKYTLQKSFSRFVLILVFTFSLTVVLGSCSDTGFDLDDDSVEDLTVVVEADKSRILEQEQEILDQQKTVQANRKRLAKERENITKQLANLSKKDKSQRDKLVQEEKRLEVEERELNQKHRRFEGERSKLEAQKSELLEKISQLTKTQGGLTVAQREQLLAKRERDLARREAALQTRLQNVAKLEQDAVTSLQELNRILAKLQGSGVTRTTVVSTSNSTGSNSRSQTIKLQKQVNNKMRAKGILVEDLPPSAQEFYEHSHQSVKAKDYNTAHDALTQLGAIVNNIKIDKNFVDGKMKRINSPEVKKSVDKLSTKKRKKIDELLMDMTNAATEGRFDRVNRKINQIYALIKG